MIDPELNYFVNLETYPIDQLDSEAGQELLKRAQTMIIRFTSYFCMKAPLARFLDEVVPLL